MKKRKKKKVGANLSWAIAQLYCKKEICIAILVLYCNLRIVLQDYNCIANRLEIVLQDNQCIAI